MKNQKKRLFSLVYVRKINWGNSRKVPGKNPG